MGVNQLANNLEVTPDTIRYYTRIGYLLARRNPNNGYKEYDNESLYRMRFILSARKIGLSVKDIGKIFEETEKGNGKTGEVVQSLINDRLNELERKLKEASVLRDRLNIARSEWAKQSRSVPPYERICKMVEELEHLDPHPQEIGKEEYNEPH